MEIKITAIVITRNEEIDLEACLKTLKWCDEVIVVDDNSKDKTVEVAKNLNAQVYARPINNDFSSQRNFGLSKAKGDWILFVDADEIISDSLAFEISNIVNQITDQRLGKYNGYYIKRYDFIWGRKLRFGETGGIRLLRLAKKNMGKWEGKVHEKWKIKGHLGMLKNPIMHFPHKTLKEFLSEINFYTTVRAKELYSQNVTIHWWSIILYPLGKFILNYIFKLGFLDKLPGLIVAVTMSFHSFLVRGKLWLLHRIDE